MTAWDITVGTKKPDETLVMGKFDLRAFYRLKETLGFKDVGIMTVLATAEVRIRRLTEERYFIMPDDEDGRGGKTWKEECLEVKDKLQKLQKKNEDKPSSWYIFYRRFIRFW
jgi:hypothetical protein